MTVDKRRYKDDDFWDFYCRELFRKFSEDFQSHKISGETIKFHKLWHWFSFRKIPKEESKAISQYWVGKRFCELVTYHGLRIKGEPLWKKNI